MKRTTPITLTLAIGIALCQPVSISAKDDAQNEQGHEKGKAKAEKVQGKNGGKAGNREQASHQPRSNSRSEKPKPSEPRTGNVRPGNAPVTRTRPSRAVPNQIVTPPGANMTTSRSRAAAQGAGAAPSRSRYAQQPGYSGQGRTGTTVVNQSSYTRSNNYGGLWVLGDTHRDWDRNRVHSWNNHRYGWYEGGWLIIDSSYRPRGYYFSNYSGDSTVMRVQTSLAEQGYPVGYADGVFGPATRTAIAEYQQDYGLAVTGRINAPLLVSLGLE